MVKRNKTRQKLIESEIDLEVGLNEEQITERKEKNWVNTVKIGTSKSYLSILAGNLFTFFNLLCFLVFLWLITVIEDINDAKNLTFMVIIFANMLIGIAQEINAKRTMDKLSLLSSPNVKVLRCGGVNNIKVNEILLGDIITLEAGCQICSDSTVREGEIEVNESLLTGESLPVKKCVGDQLMSGSFVVSGKCKSEVSAIAEQNYISKLAISAKAFKRPQSDLIKSMKLILKVIGIIVIPIAILSFLTNFNAELRLISDHGDMMFMCIGHLSEYSGSEIYAAYRAAVTPTSTAIIGVIPAGLFLLTSMALAVGVIRLSKRNALVQEIYSIETLARVNMLCLDKTGTITDGTMDVKEAVPITGFKGNISEIISSMNAALSDNNMTAQALTKKYGDDAVLEAERAVPFTSERKCSAVKFTNGETYVMGAPEFVCNSLDSYLVTKIDSYAKEGYRCLLLGCNCDNYEFPCDNAMPQNVKPCAIIIIRDNVKEDAAEIIEYFKNNEVAIRVISGDNPITVSEVAKRVGVENADKFINLYGKTDEEVIAAAAEYTVFGRVSPEQKKLLVTTFKQAGNTVAMTGDGINDILALKEADCSIAMANGSEATRNVAQLVLLDSNFSSMPKVVGEGRRVINNIERASTLFLTKTVMTIVLQLVLVFMGTSLPLEPIQLSFVNLFCIGIPSFFLAMEPNDSRIKGKFLVNVGKRVLPGAVAICINVVLIMIFAKTGLISLQDNTLNTTVMISLFLGFMLVLYNICVPFNRNRMILFTGIGAISMLCLLVMPLFKDSIFNIFNIVYVNSFVGIMMLIALMYLTYVIIKMLTWCVNNIRYKNKRLYIEGGFKKLFKTNGGDK